MTEPEKNTPLQAGFRGLIAVTLAVLALALFAPATGFDFLNLDDPLYVSENEHVLTGLSWENVRWAFQSAHENWWLPLLWISYMVDAELFGPGPFGFHLVNILLHAANAALLFWVLYRLTGFTGRSAFVAALFAVHPLRVEAVAWITARKDVLSGLFFMLTLLAYARYAERPRLRRYLLVALGLLFGLLSKAVLAVLPLLLLLLDFWPLQRAGDPLERQEWKPWGRLILEKLPLLAMAAVFAAIGFRTHISGSGAHVSMPWLSRLALAPPNYWAFVGKLIWPTRLAIVYPEDDGVRWASSGLALAGLLLITAALFKLRARRPALLVGWLWFLVQLVPVIRGVRLGIGALADRFTYLPGIGLFVLLAWGVAEKLPGDRQNGAPWRRTALLLLPALLILTAGFASARRYLTFWKNSETLYEHALAVTGDNWPIAINLAAVYHQQGRRKEEIAVLKEALRVDPYNGAAHFHLAMALEPQGRPGQSEWHFRQAILHARPFEVLLHAQIAQRLAETKDYPAAIRHFQLALQHDPGLDEVRCSLGIVHLFAGQPREAVPCFEAVLTRQPGHKRALSFLVKALLTLHRTTDAAARLREMLLAQPDSPEVLNDLAWLQAARPADPVYDPASALKHARHAADRTGRAHPGILDTLALAYAANGQFELATQTAEEAIQKAQAAGDGDLAQRMEQRMGKYRANQAWSE